MSKGVNKVTLIGNLGADPEVDALFERWCSHIVHAPADACWIWRGSLSRGYGQMSSRTGCAPYKAHRLSVFFATGQWPDGVVCHECDVPSCVNPAHLTVGTQADNMAGASERGRLNSKSLMNLRPGARGFHGAGPLSRTEIATCTA